MAIVKKGGRNIVVDGTAYRWRVRRKPTYGQEVFQGPFRFSVEKAGAGGAVLVVLVPQKHPKSVYTQDPSPILPSFVTLCIRQALVEGWTPNEPGPQFVLDLSKEIHEASLS